MREEPDAVVDASSEREGLADSEKSLRRRFQLALLLYAVLAALCWFTLEGKVLVMGRPVELRLVPLLIIGGLALRTMVAMQAEKIRRDGGKGR